MKRASAAAFVLASAIAATTSAEAQADRDGLRRCTARVAYAEELPFAPIGNWLVNVTLQITPQHGAPYYTTLQERMPWQGPPPRRGQVFNVWCDPANLNDLRLARTRSPF